MKNLFLFLVLVSISAIAASPVFGKKEPHKDYATLKLPECADCHKAEGIAPNHDADWVRGHRLLASKPDANCNQCHNQSFCLDCHSGGGINADLSTQNYGHDYIPKSHRSDWREIHPLKALDNPQTCTRCHDRRYCNDCHARFRSDNLQFLSHRRQFSDINLSSVGPNHSNFIPAQCPTCHPGGMLPAHAWSSEHAIEARRNLQACQSCHADGDVCLKCHSAKQGLGINPHPRNWGSISGKYKDRSNGRTCVICHNKF